MLSKRRFLTSAAAAAGYLAFAACGRRGASAAPAETFEITKTQAQWRAILTSEEFAVLREEHTERPGSSPLNDEHRRGTYVCGLYGDRKSVV